MTKKITIDGREISVQEEDFDYFVDHFERQGCQVDDLSGWQTKTTHEQYDFEGFLNKALEYSNKAPPDVTQFSEKSWGAAALCVKEFFLKHYGILIKSHSAKAKLIDSICCGLPVKEAIDVKNVWIRAEKSHCNFYDMNFVPETDRHSLVDAIKRMSGLIQKADVKVVEADLNSSTIVSFRKVPKDTIKIGKQAYDYNQIVF
ncbi:hypothetical protein CRE_13448 [Caenorhabditis remanei]|uniref:Uncharacterized protein n=1 Tax=Caenorhabditis remanei TaxID=31234 RepID=E3MR11_CAERE|nr:hypothetical protein CRE_13448 [Caenorhabditis remanei]